MSDKEQEKDIFGDSDDDLKDDDIPQIPNDEVMELLKDQEEPVQPLYEQDEEQDDEEFGRRRTKRKTGAKKNTKEKTKRKRKEKEPEQEEVVLPEKVIEGRKIFESAVNAIKRTKKRRKDTYDDVRLDEAIVVLREKMKMAAIKDVELNQEKKPALEKLKLLSLVEEELGKRDLYEHFLDNGILEAIRMWLEPMNDGSLPSLDIRKFLLGVLAKLPIEKDHLKESGVGKVIHFMYKCPRETAELKKQALNLMNTWSRPIIGHSMDYRDLARAEQNLDTFKRTNVRESIPASYKGTRIPAPAAHDYVIRPKPKVTLDELKDKQPDRYKRIMNHIQRLKIGTKERK
ncbi:hypothetical protein ROZALSC1DRAFT_30196 [Rozella allomycis CSF55]|uniref:TFIIS N-terminal domain-containing protein n=1 Tax=Rozella allomycis (strain CSF55) TaxID=988480 RepID=A0A4P9YGC4_ROZAC|nr:hypothetical protein ROZALSC1DRAFT_30196 [Rozella allomycis CSF55]